MEKNKLFLVSHTHWDREWYQTFEGYRQRLIVVMDDLIRIMENNENYRFFHMDGQTIMLEDYLEVRKENKEKLEKLIKEGRILIGPWYVMPDEFLISGESLVRNLKMGHEICEEYQVKPLNNGYVIDIFGHNSQFPQILKGFNIDSATLYRGIGDFDKDAFIWEAPDESQVLCIKLDRERSYSNFYFAIRWPFEGRNIDEKELIDRMKKLLDYQKPLSVSHNMLMMDGVDHIDMEQGIPDIISMINKQLEDTVIIHSTLEEFISEQKKHTDKMETLKGELYNIGYMGINNQVLKNVLSSMVHLKQMNNRCEVELTRWVEPFNALLNQYQPFDHYEYINLAWKKLMTNHPHDSICGCSITRVHQDNEYRYHQMLDIAENINNSQFKYIASNVECTGLLGEKILVLFNQSLNEKNEIVQADIEFPADSSGNFRIYDASNQEIEYQIIGCQKNMTKKVVEYRKLIEFTKVDTYRVSFMAKIPPLGYSTYSYRQFIDSVISRGDFMKENYHQPNRYQGSMKTSFNTWENEYIKLSYENNGLCVINKETGKIYDDLLSFEDGGDVGDGWIYRKPLLDQVYISSSLQGQLSVEFEGRNTTVLKIENTMTLPESYDFAKLRRSDTKKTMIITTFIVMDRDSKVLKFRTEIDNNIKDHRVRVLFNNNLKTDHYYTKTPFYLQKRSITRKDFSEYIETETFVAPNQGVTIMQDKSDSLVLGNMGLYEVEVSDNPSHTLFLTLFRSFKSEVGKDEGDMSYMQRKMTFDYFLILEEGKKELFALLLDCEDKRAGIRTYISDKKTGSLPLSDSLMKIEIAGALLSSLRINREGLYIIRLYNIKESAVSGSIEFKFKLKNAFIMNLNEEKIRQLDIDGKKVSIDIPKGGIITIGIERL
ncbi:MAG: hypothetical protein JXQ23_01590 [Clostridia bacterium]|nr:hypothetical protein [Clostridia bacterium]